jgi:hypothetical protein
LKKQAKMQVIFKMHMAGLGGGQKSKLSQKISFA